MSLMLGNLATTIVAEVPILLERTLKQDAENNILQAHCKNLKGEIEVVKKSIASRRAKQQRLSVKLLKLRGPPPSKSGSIRELRAVLQPRNGDADSSLLTIGSADYTFEFDSMVSDGSPVSLRSKRKGMVFSDNFRVSKKAKLNTEAS